MCYDICVATKQEGKDRMQNLDIIQNSIDYIEDNLQTEITAQELARRANFSLFHYYRLFQSAVGMPVMQYIVRRKLLHAIYEISNGGETSGKSIDIALKYGFNTYAGFYKAFKREFGHTPGQFLQRHKLNKPYRIKLSEEEHILITHKKISEILKHWNLETAAITDIFYDSGERNEHAYYIGDRYVLKLFVNLGNLKNHINISRSLGTFGLSVAAPIKTVNGEEIIEDDQLYYILTRRLQGEPVRASDLYRNDFRGKSRFLGEVIGQLNLALEKLDVVVNDKDLYDNVINRALPKVLGKLDIPEALVQGITDTFGALYPQLPRQIIHRDPHPGNIIVVNDNWGFIDFELSERNVRIFDPCYAATAILSENFDAADTDRLNKWISIYQNILYGYDSVVHLSEAEKQAVPYIILSNQLICCAWFSEQEKYRNLFETNAKMTEWICANFDRLSIE